MYICSIRILSISSSYLTILKKDASNVQGVLPAAGNMARRAHRVLMIAKREAENSEDPAYVNAVRDSFNVLNSKVSFSN